MDIPEAKWNKYGASLNDVVIAIWGNDRSYIKIKAVRLEDLLICDMTWERRESGCIGPIFKNSKYTFYDVDTAIGFFRKEARRIIKKWSDIDSLPVIRAIDDDEQLSLFGDCVCGG